MAALLFNRTCYSLLESSLTLSQMKDHCLKNGFSSIGICDKNTLFSISKAYKYFKQYNIKLIIGLEVEAIYENDLLSLLLFARNNNGFKQLSKLSYKATSNNNVELEYVLNNSNDCFCIINDNCDLFNHYYSGQNNLDLTSLIRQFTRNNVFLGYSNVSSMYQGKHQELLNIASRYNINPIAISLALYCNEAYFNSYKVLRAIDSDKDIDDSSLKINRNCHLLDVDELKAYPDDALKMTDYLAENCNVDFSYPKAELPQFTCPDNYDEKTYLKALCVKGLKKRLNNNLDNLHSERLKKELDVIINLNYANYFLIIYDLVLFAKRNGIITSVRGSAVGSLVAYCLGITNIDPLKYDLLFERFLNSQRATMPDIDLDVPDEKREYLISYLHEKYEHLNVAHIITFSTFKTKQAITDTAKVLKINANVMNQFKKLISDNVSIADLAKDPKVISLANTYPELKNLIRTAIQIENLPKASSLHAGGIVLSSKPIIDYIPVFEHDDFLTTQFTMESLEEFGLIKFDLLGLTNLTHVSKINALINDENNVPIDFNDVDTFNIFSNNHVLGIFQCESQGMRALLKRIKPKSINELSACIALFRPGPKRFIDEYIERKEGRKKVSYLHNDLEPILKETYGIVIYQEQVMKISQVLAGFSLNKADLLRKAISKKNSDEFAKLKVDFINGCIVKGLDSNQANEIFDYIDRFAQYGFNKSHSYAYAEFAYKMAFQKAHYPTFFYKVMLDINVGRNEIIKNYMAEMKERGVTLLPCDINNSYTDFSIEEYNLRIPLTQVKSINTNIANQIVETRKISPFNSFIDFVLRVKNCNIANESILMLIDAGALDCFQIARLSMKNFVENDLDLYWKLAIFNDDGTISSESDVFNEYQFRPIKENPLVKAELEKEALGFYYSDHPIRLYKKNLPEISDLGSSLPTNSRFKLLVSIKNIKEHTDKNRNVMAFIEAYDETASSDFVIMSREYSQNKNKLIINSLCILDCELSNRNSIIIKNVIEFKPDGGIE